MIEQSQSHFKCSRVFAIGGEPQDRAALCFSASNGQLAIEPLGTIDELTPSDLAVGDAYFVYNEIACLQELKSRLAEAMNFAPIIAFASQASVEDVVRAFDAGASSFIEAPFSSDKVLTAVDAAIQKSHFLGTHSDRSVAAKMRLKCLSVREREVVDALADGLSNKHIGLRLSISPRTVEIHRANAFAKLGVAHTAEAIRLVLEANFYDTLHERSARTNLGFARA